MVVSQVPLNTTPCSFPHSDGAVCGAPGRSTGAAWSRPASEQHMGSPSVLARNGGRGGGHRGLREGWDGRGRVLRYLCQCIWGRGDQLLDVGPGQADPAKQSAETLRARALRRCGYAGCAISPTGTQSRLSALRTQDSSVAHRAAVAVHCQRDCYPLCTQGRCI
jgi:hypothetical protein